MTRKPPPPPPEGAADLGLEPLPIEGLAAMEADVHVVKRRKPLGPIGEGLNAVEDLPVPVTEEVQYYAHHYSMANLAFRLRYFETWIPAQHFEPEATNPKILEKVLGAFWARVQRRFFEKLESGEVSLRDLPYRGHEDLQDMDGTVYRAFYTVRSTPDRVVVYTRARPHTWFDRQRDKESKEEGERG